MSPQLRKEIRCMFPLWLTLPGGIIFVATISGFKGDVPHQMYCIMTKFILGALPFGSEFHYKTMPLLLSQPLERARLWRSKMIVLAAALLAVTALAMMTP